MPVVWSNLMRAMSVSMVASLVSRLFMTAYDTLIYPFTGPATYHYPENGLSHLRTMECSYNLTP